MACPFGRLDIRSGYRLLQSARRSVVCGVLLGILSVVGCGNPQEERAAVLVGGARTVVESTKQTAFHDVQSELRDAGHLDGGEHIFFHDGYVDLPCVQVITARVRPQIRDQGEGCPSIVVESASEFDMVIAYRDGSCPQPPALVVEDTGGAFRLRVDTGGDRGICESGEEYKAIGINFK